MTDNELKYKTNYNLHWSETVTRGDNKGYDP